MSKQTKHAKTKSKTKDKSMDIDHIQIRGEFGNSNVSENLFQITRVSK